MRILNKNVLPTNTYLNVKKMPIETVKFYAFKILQLKNGRTEPFGNKILRILYNVFNIQTF